MSKKALMVVSFGTTYPDARRAIENLEERLRAAFPGYDFYRAFTSRMVARKIEREEGVYIPSPAELLEQLAQLQAKREEIRKVRKCPNCGASCATDAHFCSRCGMVLHEETSVVVPEEVQQSEVPEQEAPSEPEKQDEEPLIEEKL